MGETACRSQWNNSARMAIATYSLGTIALSKRFDRQTSLKHPPCLIWRTVYGGDCLQIAMEHLRSHGNCHIFARDNRSLETLRQADIAQTSAMPDMAHCLWGRLLAVVPRFYEAQPLRFVRRDDEAKASPLLEGNASTVQSY